MIGRLFVLIGHFLLILISHIRCRHRLLSFLNHTALIVVVVEIAHSDAVLAVPLVQLVDLLLGHLKQVCCAFGMEPAAINAIVLTLTHYEAPGL